MRFVSEPPIYLGRGQRGIWRVTAYSNTTVHFKDYYADSQANAKRQYLVEFGPTHGVTLNARFLKKVLDKSSKPCYNDYIK
jgi:hypothetical protein